MLPPPINVVPHICVSVCARWRRDQAWALERIFLLLILQLCLRLRHNMIRVSVQTQCHRSTAMASRCSCMGKAMRKMSR